MNERAFTTEADALATEQKAPTIGTVSMSAAPTVSHPLDKDIPTVAGSNRPKEWGRLYVPPVPDKEARRSYYRICDAMYRETQELRQLLADGSLDEEGVGPVAEIHGSLEQLYELQFAEGESLKSVVVAIQSQINNAKITDRHVAFLSDAVAHLRARYTIDEATVDAINDMIEDQGLDVFRGTVSQPEVLTHYRIVEDTGQ